MASQTIRAEESLGLLWAIALHGALVLALVLFRPSIVIPPPERAMTVTLSDEVGLEATSPNPTPEFKSDTAPELGEVPPPPAPEPEPVARPTPKVAVATRPTQRPTARPTTRPTARPSTQPSQRPSTRATPSPRPTQTGRPGGRRVGPDFLPPANPSATGSASPYLPIGQIGSNVRSSLLSAISREIKPRWVAPQGAEVDRLVTYVSWNLNDDGTLDGSPRVVRQEGITDANRPQAARHAEQAVRAVRLAAPFDLPLQYYNAWRRVIEFRFDRRLSQ